MSDAPKVVWLSRYFDNSGTYSADQHASKHGYIHGPYVHLDWFFGEVERVVAERLPEFDSEGNWFVYVRDGKTEMSDLWHASMFEDMRENYCYWLALDMPQEVGG